jgi:hypothetical protein
MATSSSFSNQSLIYHGFAVIMCVTSGVAFASGMAHAHPPKKKCFAIKFKFRIGDRKVKGHCKIPGIQNKAFLSR